MRPLPTPARLIIRLTALALLAAAVLGAPVAAQALVVPLDHSQRLHLSGAASSVLVGNPQIADVTVVDSHTLYLQGKGYGVTNLVVLDRAGRTLFSQDIIVAAGGASVSVYRGGDRTDFGCTPRCTGSSAPMASAATSIASTPGAPVSIFTAPAVASAQPMNAAFKPAGATP